MAAIFTAAQKKDISKTIEEVTIAITKMGASVEGSASGMDEIGELLDSMNTSFDSLTDNASECVGYSQEISDKANVMREDALAQKKEVFARAEEIAADMQNKIEQSKEVERIRQLTDDILAISKQTNMLALNASIESARAGEFGKGFAVVAGKINELATNTAKTAVEIQNISQTVIDCVNALAVTGSELMNFLSEKTGAGYDQLVDTANDYQNSSKIFYDMMLDFQEEFKMLNNRVSNMEGLVNSMASSAGDNARALSDVMFSASEFRDNLYRMMDADASDES